MRWEALTFLSFYLLLSHPTATLASHNTDKDHSISSKYHPCSGTGLVFGSPPTAASGTGHVTIVGGGIGGVALGIALQQRGIRYTLFEKDDCFDSRRQGYGLTMQVSLV